MESYTNSKDFVPFKEILLEDTSARTKLKTIHKKEYEYVEFLMPIESFLAHYFYYDNKSLQDSDIEQAIKHIRQNIHETPSFFTDKFEKELIGVINFTVRQAKKKICWHELFLVLGHIVWAIDNRKHMENPQGYLLWVANFFKLLNDEEMEKFNAFYDEYGEKFEVPKNILQTMKGEVEGYELPVQQEILSTLDSQKFAEAVASDPRSHKVGRNDPCPCGSGKKYKKCCLDKEYEKEQPEKNNMNLVIDFVLKKFKKEFDSLLGKYFPNRIIDNETNLHMLIDAFVFDYKLPDNKKPFNVFLEKAPLTTEERVYYEQLSENVVSGFEVLKVDIGKGIEVFDILNKEKNYLHERTGTYSVHLGSLILCRIARIDDHHEMISPAAYELPKEVVYSFKRINKSKDFNQNQEDSLSMLDIIKIVIKRSQEKMEDESLENIKKRLQRKLQALNIPLDFRQLSKRINEHITPNSAFPEIFNHDFQSRKEFLEVNDLVRELWNHHPRKEFDGKSPDEVSQCGPQELTLVRTMLTEAMQEITPKTHPNKEEAKKAINEFKDEWLNKKQQELCGKTPLEIILQERKQMGNTNTKIAYSITPE